MSIAQRQQAGRTVPRDAGRRAVIAGTLGNILEWYDFAVYGFLVPSLAAAFFPKASHVAQLLFTFGVLGVGFVMRPVGSVVIGYYGDRAGRRAALTVTVGLMGFATVAIGLLPTYAAVGAWAPLLLTLARLAQGFSAGGEWGGAAAFLVEYAPDGRRGYVGSWQQFSVGGGLLLGSAIATLLAALLGPASMAAWGWRVPFLLGVLPAGFAAYFRARLRDTPQFEAVARQHAVSANPLREMAAEHRGALLTQFGLTIHNTISFYITLFYLPSWLTFEVKLPHSQSLAVSTIGLLLLVCVIPPLGALSDRIGRRPLLIASCAGFIAFCYPLYRLASGGQFAAVLFAQCMLVLMTALFTAGAPATFAELFPTRVRYSGLSVGYNTAVMIFGGFAPFIATWLIAVTGNTLAPTFYVIAGAAVTLLFVLRMHETAFIPLRS